MTHEEFISEIQKIALDYHVRVATQIMDNVRATFGDDISTLPSPKPKPPATRHYDVDVAFEESGPPFSDPKKTTTGTVKMSAAEAKKNIERMAKAEGMVAVPGAKIISEGRDTEIHPLSSVLLSHVRVSPGVSSGALSRDSGIPGTTVRDHLKKLVAANLIVKKTTRTESGAGVAYYPVR